MGCRQSAKGQLPTMLIAPTQKKSLDTGPVDGQVLRRLAMEPRDAEALMVLYEDHEKEIKAAGSRWFGKDPEVRNKVINTILAALSRQARSYDPQSMDAAEWVRQCADAEAKRLREVLDADRRQSPGTRGVA